MDMIRVSLWIAALLGMATIAAVGLPDVRSSASMSLKSQWVEFEDDTHSFPCPEGWKAVDPFTVDYPFHGYGWLPEAPPRGAHVAYLARRDDSSELFLIRGDAGALADLEDRATAMMTAQSSAQPLESRPVPLQNGSTLVLKTASVKSPFAGREPTFCVLGSIEVGAERLLVNGGGPARSFDFAGVVEILRHLELPRAVTR